MLLKIDLLLDASFEIESLMWSSTLLMVLKIKPVKICQNKLPKFNLTVVFFAYPQKF